MAANPEEQQPFLDCLFCFAPDYRTLASRDRVSQLAAPATWQTTHILVSSQTSIWDLEEIVPERARNSGTLIVLSDYVARAATEGPESFVRWTYDVGAGTFRSTLTDLERCHEWCRDTVFPLNKRFLGPPQTRLNLGFINGQFHRSQGFMAHALFVSADTINAGHADRVGLLGCFLDALFNARETPDDFQCSTITVNKSALTPPHCDKANRGPSMTVCFGDYSGGELVVVEGSRARRDEANVPVRDWSDAAKDRMLREEGTAVDTRYKWLLFDGNDLHRTNEWRPAAADRYNLVFYRTKSPQEAQIAPDGFGEPFFDRSNYKQQITAMRKHVRLLRHGQITAEGEPVVTTDTTATTTMTTVVPTPTMADADASLPGVVDGGVPSVAGVGGVGGDNALQHNSVERARAEDDDEDEDSEDGRGAMWGLDFAAAGGGGLGNKKATTTTTKTKKKKKKKHKKRKSGGGGDTAEGDKGERKKKHKQQQQTKGEGD